MDDLAVIDGIVMKGRCIIVPEELQKQALEQLHSNHMGIDKTRLQAFKSIYWMTINADIENIIKIS